MKYIYLLRHAQAESSFDLPDKDRCLTRQGIKEARSLGSYMALNNIIPEQIKCSSAHRTIQTLENVINKLPCNNNIFLDNLYNAATSDIYEEIKSTENHINNLMILAHNPGIHAIGQFIAQNGTHEIIHKHTVSYPPNTLTIIKCDIDSWKDLQPDINEMIDYIDNKKHLE